MGAGAGSQIDALTRCPGERPVVDDDRSRSGSHVHPPPAAVPAGAQPQTACFVIGALQIELTAAPGAARLVVAAAGSRDIYVVDPNALAAWAGGTARLLSLARASDATQRAEYRAPFLIDREGRESIAIEGLVTEQAVRYRLLVSGARSKVAGLMTRADVVRQVCEAAVGAAALANKGRV